MLRHQGPLSESLSSFKQAGEAYIQLNIRHTSAIHTDLV